ncbi:hypothetical protein FRC17_005032, partial [Serendipita sp. 399]
SGTDSHGTVIWKGDNFTSSNDLTWSNDYRVFGSLSEPGAHVQATTAYQKIEFGQTCTIDETGETSATGQPDQSGTFSFTNNWKDPMHVGVKSTITIGSKSLPDLPLYVSSSKLVPQQTMHLTPVDRISVYFEADDQTIGGIPNPTWPVDFTGSNPKDVTISYNNAGEWQDGPLPKD